MMHFWRDLQSTTLDTSFLTRQEEKVLELKSVATTHRSLLAQMLGQGLQCSSPPPPPPSSPRAGEGGYEAPTSTAPSRPGCVCTASILLLPMGPP